MLLDDSEVHLKAGDVVVRRRPPRLVNRSGQPCRVAFILMDSQSRRRVRCSRDEADRHRRRHRSGIHDRYYRLFISTYRSAGQTGVILLSSSISIDLAKALKLVSSNDWRVWPHTCSRIRRLARGRRDARAVVPPHAAHRVRRGPAHVAIPLISIVETACSGYASAGEARGLFGLFHDAGRFLSEGLRGEGIEVRFPESGDQEFIHDTYLNELVMGSFLRRRASATSPSPGA